MSLPTTEINTLSFVSEGKPFSTHQPSTANTLTMAFIFAGQPFYAQGAGAVAPVATRPVCFVCM